MAATVLVGRIYAVGLFRFMHQNPIASIGFFEAFLLVAVIGLFLREASTLAVTWRWNVLAAVVHVVCATINVTHWSFYGVNDVEVLGAVATVAHIAVAALELTMARRSRAAANTGPNVDVATRTDHP